MMTLVRLAALLSLSTACGTPRTVETPTGVCDAYPPDAVRPMELDAPLYPYSWPDARNLATGVQGVLDLGLVPCAADPLIDWSPFDVLLFVSIPAW